MSRDRSVRQAARTALRHPILASQRVSRQKLKAAARLVRTLPAAWQRRLGRLLAALGGRLTRGRPDHPAGAVLLLLGEWAMGRAAEGVADAERLGAAATTSSRTALRLARTCLAIDAPGAAARIAQSVLERGGRDAAAAMALEAEIALRAGRYSVAADRARRSLEARPSAGARTVLARATSELSVLEPGWRPSLRGGRGPRSGAGRRGRIEPVRGRVLHLLTNSLPHRQAGYTVRAQSIGRSQIDVGLDPHFATRAGFPLSVGVLRAPRDEDVAGVPYHRLAPDLDPAAGPERIATETARAAERLVERLRPAVLHPASNFLNAQVALALRDRFGLPVVYEVRGFLEETWVARRERGDDPATDAAPDADRYRGEKAAETDVMLAADAVVTLSETMRADILARGCHPEAVVVVPNAVDVERFTPRPRDDALAASLGIEPGEAVLGYVSTLWAYEGIRFLIAAGALLKQRGRRVRVLIVGDGEERAALESEARRLGVLDGTVIFAGRVPHAEIQRYYSVMDVFVVPRTNDRVSRLVTPLKPFEAMALERALVVSRVDALTEIVSDGETGLTFRPEDPADLADVVEPLLDDPGRRASLGRAARAWVAEHRTWRQNGERYRALYVRLGAV